MAQPDMVPAAIESETKVSPRSDFRSGLGWTALGLAIVYGSWTMDRLAHLNVSPYTVPGLVPGVLGVCIAFMGAILTFRAISQGALKATPRGGINFAEHARLYVSLAFCLMFGLVLMGHGLPFWLAAALYISGFVALFQWPERQEKGQNLRGLLVAIGFGLIVGLVIHYVFEDLFLVRMP
ncbi:tripartite tricarboxylate transporter TctB family protein [Ferrovibrio sp.]|uniref:tripartite tricarboxylate transporter TctB family protein n=1 Tax=Ferrovibrio sp. TaxID=1917215 RepID=UPI0025BEB7D1|nr:tripartite tricarboxylate transporter TctB family protein [Ferrovibrio sp.]MBX3455444.1 tripartite tricarboxylate transporter TctB family protein [Ferrovibrio sp.]